MVMFAVATTRIHVAFDPMVFGVFVFGVGILLVDHYMVVEVIAELATTYRRFAGLDLPAMARERRGTSAAAMAIALATVRACTQVRFSQQIAHRLMARLRAAVGVVSFTSHPRLAAAIAAVPLRTFAA